MTNTTMDGTRGEFNFIFIQQNHNEGIYSFRKSFIRRIFAFKGIFEFDWITHRQFDGQPILCGENILRRTWYQQRLRAEH